MFFDCFDFLELCVSTSDPIRSPITTSQNIILIQKEEDILEVDGRGRAIGTRLKNVRRLDDGKRSGKAPRD
jgi:hypothetical protein